MDACRHCEGPLPTGSRSDRRWCSERCKSNSRHVPKGVALCVRCKTASAPSPWAEYCATCRAEVRAEIGRKCYENNREVAKARAAAYAKANPERVDECSFQRRLRRYGISLEKYEAMLAEQSGRCALCRTSDPGRGNRRWCVDHDPETGRVRGLLCMDCNAHHVASNTSRSVDAVVRYLGFEDSVEMSGEGR